jgi:hypothetical protein
MSSGPKSKVRHETNSSKPQNKSPRNNLKPPKILGESKITLRTKIAAINCRVVQELHKSSQNLHSAPVH